MSRLRQEIDADPGALSRRQQAQRERAAAERQRRVEQAWAVMDRLDAGRHRAAGQHGPPRRGAAGLDHRPRSAGDEDG